MKRSAEIEKLVRDTLAAYERNDISFIERTTSKDPAVVSIGTDASEYVRGHEKIVNALRQELSGSRLKARVDEIHAYEDGDFGWSDGTGTFEMNGKSVEVRTTAVFLREGGEWRVMQSHSSIGVPNERMFDPLFQGHATKT